MRAALKDAGITENAVGYLNLHATATFKNDAMESRAVARVFPDGVASSGTKPLTGHTLGAAGATELAFCLLALQANKLPPHIWDGQVDPDMPALNLINNAQAFRSNASRICMSNSFAFGGSNASLIIGESR
jgi:3-oxoacyl-[acyl-carrier-protein] synthase-1